MAAVLVAAFAVPQSLIAQASQHLVSPADLQKAAADASQARQQNIDTLNRFLSSDRAQKAMESAHINPQQVKNAVSGLSDEELAQLAARAQKAQADFAAGNIDNRDLLIILVCIAALILIIVAVH
jgi:Flp pilus assembly protein TadB